MSECVLMGAALINLGWNVVNEPFSSTYSGVFWTLTFFVNYFKSKLSFQPFWLKYLLKNSWYLSWQCQFWGSAIFLVFIFISLSLCFHPEHPTLLFITVSVFYVMQSAVTRHEADIWFQMASVVGVLTFFWVSPATLWILST